MESIFVPLWPWFIHTWAHPIFHSSQRRRTGRVREETGAIMKVWNRSCQRSNKVSSAWRRGGEASREGEWSTDALDQKAMWCERAGGKLLINSSNRGTEGTKWRHQDSDTNQSQEVVCLAVGRTPQIDFWQSIKHANIAVDSRKGWTGAGGGIC